MKMKSKVNNIYFLLTLLGVIWITPLFSQNNAGADEIFLGVGSGSRTIAKAQKTAISPSQIDSTLQMDEVKYYLEPKQQEVSYEIENITPAKLKIVEPLDRLYSG